MHICLQNIFNTKENYIKIQFYFQGTTIQWFRIFYYTNKNLVDLPFEDFKCCTYSSIESTRIAVFLFDIQPGCIGNIKQILFYVSCSRHFPYLMMHIGSDVRQLSWPWESLNALCNLPMLGIFCIAHEVPSPVKKSALLSK